MTTAIYTHPDCKLHEMGAWHPESPARLQAIEDQLIASRIAPFLDYRLAPLADLADIARVHLPEAIARVRDNIPVALAAEMGKGGPYFPLDGDTSLNPYSWQAALRASGAAVAATEAVIAGEIENAFCAIRPPGHHAIPSASMGFCLFNNVAIAARHALDQCGLQRVAIVDFDVHHGNGTEAAFQNDPRVLMVSFFQHPLYPYTEVHADHAQPDNMVNIPVPAYTRGDAIRTLIEQQWLPVLDAHKPEMIFISAGFDAHRDDELAQLALVEADFLWITEQIMIVADRHAQGRIVSCLEGGYNLSALARSVVAHVKALARLT
jgi:acetoin utilization deacetylase AcuC-like enzyme